MRIRSRHLGLAMCVALAVHVAAAIAMVLEPEEKGAAATGSGGIAVSLGPSGGAPGSAAQVVSEIEKADPVDTAPPPAAKPVAPPPRKAEVEAPPPETATPRTPPPPVRAEAPVEVAEVVRPVDEVIAIAKLEPQPESQAEPLPEPATVERPAPPEPPAETMPDPVEVARVEPDAAAVETPAIETPPLPVTRPTPLTLEKAAAEPVQEVQRTAAVMAVVTATVTADAPSEDEGPSAPSPSSASDGRSGSGASAHGGAAESSSGGGRPGVSTDYVSILQAWLEEHKEYPRRARSRRQEGVVYLYFVMDRGGRVLQHRIDRSSGYSLLDREVEAMIRRAEPLPAMPDDMTQARLELVVPVQFRLR